MAHGGTTAESRVRRVLVCSCDQESCSCFIQQLFCHIFLALQIKVFLLALFVEQKSTLNERFTLSSAKNTMLWGFFLPQCYNSVSQTGFFISLWTHVRNDIQRHSCWNPNMVAGQRRYQTDRVTAAEITSICHTVQDPEKYQEPSF